MIAKPDFITAEKGAYPSDESTLDPRDGASSPTEADADESAEAAAAAAAPPDGGLEAWLQVLAGFLAVFNTLGYPISFAIFQPHYTASLGAPAPAVSWIGSTQLCLVYLLGIPAGRAFDTGHHLAALRAGILLQLAGVFATSCAARYWQVFLAQGLCQGAGCGLVYAPTLVNVGSYFSRRRTLAIAAVASGSAAGGLVFPAIARAVLPRAGFAWAVRAMGFVMLANWACVLCLTRTRLVPRKGGSLIDLRAFRDPAYALFCAAMFFALWATFFAYYYSRSYALDILAGSQASSFSVLMLVNGVGIPGRLVPAYLADRLASPLLVMGPTVLGAAAAVLAWPAVRSLAADYAWVLVFGFFGSGIQGLLPAVCAALTRPAEQDRAGTRTGMLFSIVSIACLTGPPLAGELNRVGAGRRGNPYLGAQMWAGGCLVLGAALTAAAYWARRRARLRNEGAAVDVDVVVSRERDVVENEKRPE